MVTVDGVANLKVEQQYSCRNWTYGYGLRRPCAGFTAGHVRRAGMTLVKGLKVGELYRDQKIYDVFVWGAENIRNDISKFELTADRDPAWHAYPGLDAAEITLVPAPNEIKREGASRRIDVTCDVQGTRPGERRPRGGKTDRALDFDREYHPEFLGKYAAREESCRRLMALIGAVAPGDLVDHSR